MRPSGNVSWRGWHRISRKVSARVALPVGNWRVVNCDLPSFIAWDVGEVQNLNTCWVAEINFSHLFCDEEGWHQCQNNNPCDVFHSFFSHFAPPRIFKSPSPPHYAAKCRPSEDVETTSFAFLVFLLLRYGMKTDIVLLNLAGCSSKINIYKQINMCIACVYLYYL